MSILSIFHAALLCGELYTIKKRSRIPLRSQRLYLCDMWHYTYHYKIIVWTKFSLQRRSWNRNTYPESKASYKSSKDPDSAIRIEFGALLMKICPKPAYICIRGMTKEVKSAQKLHLFTLINFLIIVFFSPALGKNLYFGAPLDSLLDLFRIILK